MQAKPDQDKRARREACSCGSLWTSGSDTHQYGFKSPFVPWSNHLFSGVWQDAPQHCEQPWQEILIERTLRLCLETLTNRRLCRGNIQFVRVLGSSIILQKKTYRRGSDNGTSACLRFVQPDRGSSVLLKIHPLRRRVGTTFLLYLSRWSCS